MRKQSVAVMPIDDSFAEGICHGSGFRSITSVQRRGMRAFSRSAFSNGTNSLGMRFHPQLDTTSKSGGKPAASASRRPTLIILSWPLRSLSNVSSAYRLSSMPEVV